MLSLLITIMHRNILKWTAFASPLHFAHFILSIYFRQVCDMSKCVTAEVTLIRG